MSITEVTLHVPAVAAEPFFLALACHNVAEGWKGMMEAPPLERKLVAILAADVEGYSRLMGIDEEGTLEILSAFRNITDALIAQHGGRICGTAGDSVLASFASVFAAVQCAVEIQQHIAHANQDIVEDRRMWFRIGVNVGDVMLKDGDIFGDGVNIATRLEGLADRGGICISRGVHDHVMRKLSYQFEDLGEKSVKNIAQPIRVFRLIFDPTKSEPFDILTMKGAGPVLDADADVGLVGEPHQDPDPAESLSVELMFWDTIKDSLRGSDYEAYLTQYPEGAFVTLARLRLQEFASAHASRDPKDREVELLFWQSVRDSGSAVAVQAYLDKYPEGEFKPLAEIHLAELGIQPGLGAAT